MKRKTLTTQRSAVRSLSIVACAWLLGVFYHAPPAIGERVTTPMRVHIQGNSVSFREAVRILAARTKHGILVDGEPRRQVAPLAIDAEPELALKQVCEAFDYSSTSSKCGVILLRKRFTDDHELPQLNELEMIRVSQDLLNVVRSFAYDPAIHAGDVLRKLASTFPAPVMLALRNGESLRIGDLAPAQRALAEHSIYSALIYITYVGWESLNGRLRNLARGDLHAETLDEKNPYTGEVTKHDHLFFRTKDRSGRSYGQMLTSFQTFYRKE